MAKLVARQAVDTTLLTGISILFDSDTAYFYDRGSRSFNVDDAVLKPLTVKVEGSGFSHVLSQPTGAGTVSSLTVLDGTKIEYKISGLRVKLDKLLDADLETATKALFGGRDKFIGSEGNDILAGQGGKDDLRGKGGSDTLYGGNGRDRLDGGEGSDTLDGGKGRDTYVFKSTLDPGQADRIVKFQKGETLELSAKLFSALETGNLPDEQFLLVGSRVQDADDHILYDATTGLVSYDADGLGGAAPLAFAYVQIGAKLDAGSIIIA